MWSNAQGIAILVGSDQNLECRENLPLTGMSTTDSAIRNYNNLLLIVIVTHWIRRREFGS